jgi:ribulose-phosphate 3-epimerase
MAEKKRLVPAVLTDDIKALENMVHAAETFTDFVQVDIMDGRFVPSRSISGADLTSLTIKLDWEAHLMVLEPEKYLADFKAAGARRIVFHYEATDSPQAVINIARRFGLEVGLAINPETPVSATLPVVSQVDSVLLLSVNPGFYGSPFIPEVTDKVTGLRNIQPEIEIGIDGGIKASNIREVSDSGVDYVCVGSAIFLQPDPAVAFQHLQSLMH